MYRDNDGELCSVRRDSILLEGPGSDGLMRVRWEVFFGAVGGAIIARPIINRWSGFHVVHVHDASAASTTSRRTYLCRMTSSAAS